MCKHQYDGPDVPPISYGHYPDIWNREPEEDRPTQPLSPEDLTTEGNNNGTQHAPDENGSDQGGNQGR